MRASWTFVDRVQPRLLAVGGLLLAALILGGGTRSGHLSDAILQALAIPVLIWSCATVLSTVTGRLAWIAIAIAAGCVAVSVLQMLPLVPTSWRSPGSELAGEIKHLVGDGVGLGSVSISPRATLLAALAGLPALAVFLGTICLTRRQRRQLSLAVLLMGALAVFLGLLQVAEGPNSLLRFYAITNPSEAVGFFANRNHFSALLYVLLLFAAAWGVHAALRFGDAPARRRFDAAIVLPLILALTLVVVLVAAQTFARSRAGLGLTMVALVGGALLSVSGRHGPKGLTATRLVMGASLIGVLLAIQFALYRVLERFEVDPLSDARIPFATNTIEAARAQLPLGAGLGTFVPIYGLFEKPSDAMVDTFANRAHNDFLEIWLETGLAGAILLAGFLGWLLLAIGRAWGKEDNAAVLDVALVRAAGVAIILLLLHSLVDYPLRTAALQCLFAAACAFLIPAPGDPRGEPVESGTGAARATPPPRKPVSTAPAAPSPHGVAWPAREPNHQAPSTAPETRSGSSPRGEQWGRNVAWPLEWQKATPPSSAGARTRDDGVRDTAARIKPAPAANAAPSGTTASGESSRQSVARDSGWVGPDTKRDYKI
jgi:O-antigen ligase